MRKLVRMCRVPMPRSPLKGSSISPLQSGCKYLSLHKRVEYSWGVCFCLLTDISRENSPDERGKGAGQGQSGMQLGFRGNHGGYLMKYIIIFEIRMQGAIESLSDSEMYSPEGDSGEAPEGRGRYSRRMESPAMQSVEGKWTDEENLKYVLFIDCHYTIFASKEKRKSSRIFKALSDFLHTRTPRQCRSHFQKIMSKFKKLKKIKQYYQVLLGEEYNVKLKEVALAINSSLKLEHGQIEKRSVETQTDRTQVSLNDLSNKDVICLMELLNSYSKVQIPFWINPPPFLP